MNIIITVDELTDKEVDDLVEQTILDWQIDGIKVTNYRIEPE